jgi:hypothetical protein
VTLPDFLPDGRPVLKGKPGAHRFAALMDGTGGPLVDPRLGASRLIGDIGQLEVGCIAWSQERRTLQGSSDTPVGGLVVSIAERVEQETGEIVPTFVTIDPYNTRPLIRTRVLTPAEIDRETMERADDGLVRGLVRRLAEEIGKSRGPITQKLIEFDRWQHSLVSVVIPGGPTT